MSKLTRKSQKGFTLIELMIVVAIIGILAAIAIPNFLRFQLKAKSSEGKVNIAAIRTAEESYLAEFGSYVAALPNPAVNGGTTKVPFVPTIPTANFGLLGWSPEGNVFFSYSVGGVIAIPPSYTISANANIDGVAVNQVWGYVKSIPATIPPVGTTFAGCVTTGTAGGADPATQTELDTVGPCTAGHGSSIF